MTSRRAEMPETVVWINGPLLIALPPFGQSDIAVTSHGDQLQSWLNGIV
ncbi:hypothetical protein EMIT0196P_60166 [Pseudomonas chlororaphis]